MSIVKRDRPDPDLPMPASRLMPLSQLPRQRHRGADRFPLPRSSPSHN